MVHTLLVMIRGSQSEAIGFAFCVIIYIYTILVKTLVWLWLGSHVSFFFFHRVVWKRGSGMDIFPPHLFLWHHTLYTCLPPYCKKSRGFARLSKIVILYYVFGQIVHPRMYF